MVEKTRFSKSYATQTFFFCIKSNSRENYHLDEDDDEYGECDDFDDENNFEISTSALDKTLPLVALPLYSVLPIGEQKRIFKEYEDPIRKVVVATNVAETSLTIPGKYIFFVENLLYQRVTRVIFSS